MQLQLVLVVLCKTINVCAFFFKDGVSGEMSTDTATCLVRADVLISIIDVHKLYESIF